MKRLGTKICHHALAALFALSVFGSSPSVTLAASLTLAPTGTPQAKNEISIETLEFSMKR
jgi:hypothetical protein